MNSITDIGIVSYGAYLPKNSLERKIIGKTWDFPVFPGSIAVANIDEDSVTMAVEAGLDCLSGYDCSKVDCLFFATTTPIYTEKSSSSLIATVLNLRDDIITEDFSDSLKAGTSAITRAADILKANEKIKTVLVIAADIRSPQPSTMEEYNYGDGAAAFLISRDSDVPITIIGYESNTIHSTGPWKRYGNKDPFVRTFDSKLDSRLFVEGTIKVISELLNRYTTKPDEIRALALSFDGKSDAIARGLKFAKGVGQSGLWLNVGDLGTTMPLMALIEIMEHPLVDGKILACGFGDGADAILFKITDKKKLKDLVDSRLGLANHLKSMTLLRKYSEYINNKKLLVKDRFIRRSTFIELWRDSDSVYKMFGLQCKKCGTIQFPTMMNSCSKCRADRQFNFAKLALIGEVFTFTLDHIEGAAYYDIPIPKCIVDHKGGGRSFLPMTDIQDPEKNVSIGMKVELTFRHQHEGGNYHNYFWKCRPVRGRKYRNEVEILGGKTYGQ